MLPSDPVYRGPQPPSIDLPVFRVTRHGEPPDVVKPLEAKVAARGIFDTMVLTSPNMDYIPEYPVESSMINLYSDGRYGRHEYSRWPQNLKRDMWHVACIPSQPLPPDVPCILWETLLPETHWVQECTIGLTEVGYIASETREALFAAAISAIRRCEEMKASARLTKYGRLLVMILRRVVDSLRFCPVAARIAIGVAAHVQRVCLELAGLKTYAEVVSPRLRSMVDYSSSILPVVGAFVRDGCDAQTCARVGLPTYFLRPLTHELAVWKVVECQAPSFGHSVVRLAGIPNPTKDWLSDMLLFVSEYVAGSHLAPMEIAQLSQLTKDEENSPKRRRIENLTAPQSATPKKKRRSKRQRSNPGDTQTSYVGPTPRHPFPVALPSDSSCHGLPGAPRYAAGDPHPSKHFLPSPFYDVSPVWDTALRAVTPVARASTPAMYYYPPPFLLDTVSSMASLPTTCKHPERARMDEKVHRYMHNFVRIRKFCGMRMFDATLSNGPLTIEAWRTALWGDYDVEQSKLYLLSQEDCYQRRSALHRYEERQTIRRLFGTTAHFASYSGNETLQLVGMHVDIATIVANPRVRGYILWETHEANFRAELLCLDTIMVQQPTWSFSQRLEREFFVSRIWGSPSSFMHVLPNRYSRDSSFRWFSPPMQEWKDCCETLRYFTAVLTSWPDCPSDVQHGLSPEVSEEAFTRVQTAAVNFYVHTFVKTFARLPIPPIMLSS